VRAGLLSLPQQNAPSDLRGPSGWATRSPRDITLAQMDERSLRARVLQENATDLLDGRGVSLRGVARMYHQLRVDGLDVGAVVADDAVALLLERARAAHGDDRMGVDAGCDRNLRERFHERVPGRHVVDARRQ